MKPINKDLYKIPARTIAEYQWGLNGTHSARTNRKGAYYYACSGHGGYVLDPRCLTGDEVAKLETFGFKPDHYDVLIQGDNIIGVNLNPIKSFGPWKSKRHRFDPSKGHTDWHRQYVYIFEEDCDWAVLEFCTDIRVKKTHLTKEISEEWIARTINSYCNIANIRKVNELCAA